MTPPPFHLFVSYNDEGAPIRRKLAREAACALAPCEGAPLVWDAAMKGLDPRQLPPGAGEILVHPVFMQSGYAAEELLPSHLREAYDRRGEKPILRQLPVWGASPGLAAETAPLLLPRLQPDAGVLLVAHGKKGGTVAPEPGAFAVALGRLLPGAEVRLAFFGGASRYEDDLAAFAGDEVMVLPFLAGRGTHYRNDMPTPRCAARCGKRVMLMPPLGDLLASTSSNTLF